MNTLEVNRAPQPQESLAQYLRRVRTGMGLSQRELAEGAGIHLQSIDKLERSKTAKLNCKTQSGLAYALQIPLEYLTAIGRGVAVESSPAVKFCPSCWTPGTAPDPIWLPQVRELAHYDAAVTRHRHLSLIRDYFYIYMLSLSQGMMPNWIVPSTAT
jgi:transcriptional regulator with XRE-family HTH domain